MFFLLSCLLKSCLSFLTLVTVFSDYQVDSILVIFLSFQIIILDYFIFLNNEIPYLDFSFFNDIKLFTFKRKFAAISSACIFIGSMCFFVSPLYSSENISIPELSGLKQYTADTNFMSFEGYIISHFRARYGKEISRGEARKIVKDYFKKRSEYSTVENGEVISNINHVKADVNPHRLSRWKANEEKCKNVIASMKKITGGVEHNVSSGARGELPALEISYGKPEKKITAAADKTETEDEKGIKSYTGTGTAKFEVSSPVKDKSIEVASAGSNYNSKRIVLLPFKISAGGFEALDNITYFTKKYFANKGFEVVSGADVSGVCFNLENLTDSKIKEIAEKFDANYVITGEVNKYKRYKKAQTFGLLFDVVFFGFHNFGEVELNAKIFNASNLKSYCYGEKMTRKHQFLGAFNGTRGVMSYAVKAVVEQVYSKFNM